MGRLVDVDDLVSAPQIAERCGLGHTETVYNWVTRYPAFPAAVWKAGRVRLWVWSEVRAWAIATGRLTDEAP